MENLWNDIDAREYAARYRGENHHHITPKIKCHTRTVRRPHARVQSSGGAGATFNCRTNINTDNDILLQAYATTLLGADNDLTMHGGGNTSIKTNFVDHNTNTAKRALYVKASGTPLDRFTPNDFVALDLEFLEELRSLDKLDDETMAREFERCRLSSGGLQPSIETLMHGAVGGRVVDHTHPAAILKIVNRVDGGELLRECFGEELAVVEYARMGGDLARAVGGASGGRGVVGVVMRHHGLVVWGEGVKEVYDRTIEIVTRAEEFLVTLKSVFGDGGYPRNAPPKTQYPKSDTLKPLCRQKSPFGDFSTLKSTEASTVLLDSDDVMELIRLPEGKNIIGELTPDYPMYSRIKLVWREGGDNNINNIPIPADEELPVAIINPKSGVVCCGIDEKSAKRTADYVGQALSIRRAIFETGGIYEPLSEEFILDMTHRGYQSYHQQNQQLSSSPPPPPNSPNSRVNFPPWLKRGIARGGRHGEVVDLLSSHKLNTVCAEAKCPNRGECYGRGSAAFLILGAVCTRECAFCGVASGKPKAVDVDEGERVAEAACRMGLRHVVITSVTRDDLPDGGAAAFADVIKKLRDKIPSATIEVLIPDFQGSESALLTVLNARPDVLNHNIETVPRLYHTIRPQAIYTRSVGLLKMAADHGGSSVKSGIMVGLGETVQEVKEVMYDLRGAGCSIITIGQYLRPSRRQTPVVEFITPEQFKLYESMALDMGFNKAFCAPYVRSSYRAEELVHKSHD